MPFPDGADARALDARAVARVMFGGTARPDPVFAAAPRRRSAKLPSDLTRPVRDAEVEALRGALLNLASLGAATSSGGPG